MQSLELSAKSVGEATKTAAEKFGVSEDQIKVTVLEQVKGLFGKSSIRVRAEVIPSEVAPAAAPPVADAPVAAPEKAKKPAKGKAAKVEEVVVEEAPATPAPEPQKEEKAGVPRRLGRKSDAAPAAPAEVAPAAVVSATAVSAVAAEPAPKSRREKSAPKASAPASEKVEAEGGAEATEEEPTDGVQATQEDADRLLKVLTDIIASSNLEVSATVTQVGGRYVSMQLDGKDAAYLVGKHGEVVNALQYLVNIICGRRYNNGVRATIDANDYRKRREEALTRLANKVADQVIERGEEAVLDVLPAFERRIVHKALSVRSGIATYSEGEEPNRRVVIAPAD